MSSPFEVKPYKKIDGIHEEEIKGWDKFWVSFGKFFSQGLAGKWKIEFKIKF